MKRQRGYLLVEETVGLEVVREVANDVRVGEDMSLSCRPTRESDPRDELFRRQVREQSTVLRTNKKPEGYLLTGPAQNIQFGSKSALWVGPCWDGGRVDA